MKALSNRIKVVTLPELFVPPVAKPVNEGEENEMRAMVGEIARLRRLIAETREELLRLGAMAEERQELVQFARARELRFRATMSVAPQR